MVATGLRTTVAAAAGLLSQDNTPRTAGLGLVVEHVNSRPLLVAPGGVMAANQHGSEGGGVLIGAIVDGIVQANSSQWYLFPRIELGDVLVPGTTTYTLSGETNSSWERNPTVWTNGGVSFDLTVSRLTPALRLSTAQTALRLFGGTVTKRTVNSGTISAASEGDSVPKWIAYPSGGGIVRQELSSTAHTFGAFDAPWALVWWGARSHFCETTAPTTYSYAQQNGTGAATIPQSFAYQADVPLLLVFQNTPTSVSQPASGGGVQLNWGAGAGHVVTMPLYGREHLPSATTEGWGATFPTDVQTRCAFWSVRLYQYPETVAETFSTSTANGGSVTTTTTFTYTTVQSGGTQWAPIAPMLGIVQQHGWPAFSFSGTVVQGNCPTDFGPALGIQGTNTYSWTLTGTDAYTAPRAVPGGGSKDAALQAELDALLDTIISKGHLRPWFWVDRGASDDIIADVYGSNPADLRWMLAEALLLASAAQQTALATYLANEEAAYPLATSYLISASAGTQRHTTAAHNTHYSTRRAEHLFQTRATIWNAWALARQHQVTGTTPTATQFTDCQSLFAAEQDELDWATGHPFAGFQERTTAVHESNRRVAGLLGYRWIAQQRGETTAATAALAAFAREALLRVAMGHYPRWLAAAGTAAGALLTYPTGSLGTTWQPNLLTSRWPGFLHVTPWSTSQDDPRQVTTLNQFHVYLHDTHAWRGWADGITNAFVPAYRDLTPPVALLLKNALGSDALILREKFRQHAPHWTAPFFYATLGQEYGLHSPVDHHQTWLSGLWIGSEGSNQDTLIHDMGISMLADGTDEFYVLRLSETLRLQADGEPAPDVPISNIQTNLSGGAIAQWSKLQITFDLTTPATNPYWTYDASPPAGIAAEVGVTVDLLLSSNGGATWSVQPCVYDEPRTYETRENGTRDWIMPTGAVRWMARASFPTAGTWQYKVRVIDSDHPSGVETTAQSFSVTASSAKGFIRTAASNPRQWEYSNGAHFPGVGINVRSISVRSPVAEGGSLIAAYGTHKMRNGRLWPPGLNAAFGDFASPWRAKTPQNGWSEWYESNTNRVPSKIEAFDGRELYANIWNLNASSLTDYWHRPAITLVDRPIAVEPNTQYRLWVRYAIPTTLTGTAGTPAGEFGFTIKESGWLDAPDPWRFATGTNRITPLKTAATGGWTTAEQTFTTGASQHFVEHLWLTMINCQDATGTEPVGGSDTMIDEVRLQKVLGGDAYGPNLVPKPSFNGHQYVDQDAVYRLDRVIEQAETAGITFRLILADKEDQVLAGFDLTTGAWVGANANRFYGPNDSSINKSRWLLRCWWRYAQGRWGYSSAVHSWELLNEGNPNEGRHFFLAALFAQVMQGFHNRHLVSTSFWTDFPVPYWSTSPLDYATVHQYLYADNDPQNTRTVNFSTNQTALLVPNGARTDTVLAHLHLSTTLSPLLTDRPILRSETGVTGTQPGGWHQFSSGDPAKVWMHKWLWAQLRGELIESFFWDAEQVHPGGTMTHLAYFGRFVDFLAPIPLNNGNYVDAAATAANGSGGNANLMRLVGQKDPTNGRAHLWLDNTTHTTGTVQAGTPPTAIGAGVQISIPDMPAGTYQVTWVDTTTGQTTDGGTVEVT